MAFMKLIKKKDKRNAPSCPCSFPEEKTAAGSVNEKTDASDASASIKVLGTGCKSCHDLYEITKKVAAEMGLSADVEYITDLEEIMEFGVMSMPALVINNKVVSAGKVLKPADVKGILEKAGF